MNVLKWWRAEDYKFDLFCFNTPESQTKLVMVVKSNASLVKNVYFFLFLQLNVWASWLCSNFCWTALRCVWVCVCGRLWLRGRASILLSEGHSLDSPGLLVNVSLGSIPNHKLLLMCWSAPCMTATAIGAWMYVWITGSCFGQKNLINVNVVCYIQQALLAFFSLTNA